MLKLGNRIRELRLEGGLTLEELSKKSSIALATLSRIENEKMTGTLESHIRICKALGIPLPHLYTGLFGEETSIEVNKKMKNDIFVHHKASVSEIMLSNASEKKMSPTLISIRPMGSTDKETDKVGTEKFIYVIAGEIHAIIGVEEFNITAGESIYFNSSIPYQFKNTTNNDSKLLCVTTPSKS